MICFRLKVETLIIPFRLIPLFLCFNLVQSPIDIKTFHVESDVELTQELIALIPKFFTYFLSFMILGLLWFEHQMVSHYISRSDRAHIWLNLLFLMSISLIPFSTIHFWQI